MTSKKSPRVIVNPKRGSAKTFAVILALGRGERRLDGSKSVPSGLERVVGEAPALQWILRALETPVVGEIIYAGGYHLEKIVEAFPQLKVRFLKNWGEKNEVLSLNEILKTILGDVLVIDAKTIVLPAAITNLEDIARSADFKNNILIGKTASLESTPLLFRIPAARFSDFITATTSVQDSRRLKKIADVLPLLPFCKKIDLSNYIADSHDDQSVRKLIFAGKARTLSHLNDVVKTAVIPDQYSFTVEKWEMARDAVLAEIQLRFSKGVLAVRSSACSEDSFLQSSAGLYHSALGIRANDKKAIQLGINAVIESYGRHNRKRSKTDHVLVQQQILDLRCSGVIFTRDSVSGAPYYVINSEAGSGRSDIVTSGSSGNVRTLFQSWDAPMDQFGFDFGKAVNLAAELRSLTCSDAIDIEFGIDGQGVTYLFQARPMTMATAIEVVSQEDLRGIREAAAEFFGERTQKYPGIPGKKTVFANMSDWNPAEMIGTAPKPLALSMYQYLIGDWAWADARARIGYRNVGPEPLIHSFGGKPYVDVRLSLASLLPEQMDEEISELWVEDCLQRLREEPERQDKIEFDLTVTCLAFDWELHRERMQKAGLSKPQIKSFKDSLALLTQRILAGETQTIHQQLATVSILEEFRKQTKQLNIANASAAVRKTQTLLDRCTRLGIIPFAILARYGFVAMSFMRSLRDVGVINTDEYDRVLRSVPTVAGRFHQDLSAFQRGEKDESDLVLAYGHLRPHSYEITSPSYADMPAVFSRLSKGMEGKAVPWQEAEDVFRRRDALIQTLLRDLGLNVSTLELAGFIKKAIAGREEAKFNFMKTVDEALKTMIIAGQFLGLSREDMAYLKISDIIGYSRGSMSGATASRLAKTVSYNRKRHELTQALRLPDVLLGPQDFQGFVMRAGKPNFVTKKRIVGQVILVEEFCAGIELNGQIVAIRAADPGFDWIFGHGIVGLVTEYGGIASHMAIRAAEFGIPSAIGCGSIIFESIAKAEQVDLDCANERIFTA